MVSNGGASLERRGLKPLLQIMSKTKMRRKKKG
jgi:hypothetical protein